MRHTLLFFTFFLFSGLAQAGPVNINTASGQRLDDELIGIGPALAARIVRYREAHGLFETPEEMQNVPYIGIKTFEKNRPYILVGDS
jgi:competence ComEA-like helix-hairpin-helix protein